MYLKHWIEVSTQHVRETHVAYLQALLEFLLLFVDYAESEVDLVCLFKIWLHAHDLRESLFGVFQ